MPTENTHKVGLLRAHELAHTRGVLHVLAQKQPSDVPNQPYDAQGPQGAVNRTRHTLAWLVSPAGQAYLARHAIGHMVVAAIENFIACAGAVTPGDYACVLRTRVTAGTCQLGVSAGVEVPRDCLARAQQAGSHLTVGKVIAQRCPGLRDDD